VVPGDEGQGSGVDGSGEAVAGCGSHAGICPKVAIPRFL
jgi:hypothetical protein